MTITTINHPRKQVQFGGYSGLAGVVEHEDGGLTISFPGRRRDFREVHTGTVGEAAVKVARIEDSATVKGAVLITASTDAG